MTRRTCPWCGGDNLILRSCSGSDPKRHHTSYNFWEDNKCGYKEKTSATEYYDYEKSAFVSCEREIISIHKPRPPLPDYQQQDYIRNGISVPIPENQSTLGES